MEGVGYDPKIDLTKIFFTRVYRLWSILPIDNLEPILNFLKAAVILTAAFIL